MRILITSGGGAKGAFTVGALQHLRDVLPGGFDFISGTSTGALIAAMVAANRLQDLENVYKTTTNSMILEPMDIVDSATSGQPYIYGTQPLLEQVKTYLTSDAYDTIMQSNTLLCLNSVCLQTGRITVFSTKPINSSQAYDIIPINNFQMMIDGLMGSSNQAAFMKPVEIGGKQYVDGGNREVIPTRVVVNNISTEEDHEIYVLSNNPHELVTINKTFTNILEVLFRAITMFIQEVRENDLETLVGFRLASSGNVRIFYIYPEEELDRQFPTGLRFDPFRMRTWMEEGKQRAETILNQFPNGNLGLVA